MSLFIEDEKTWIPERFFIESEIHDQLLVCSSRVRVVSSAAQAD